MEETEKSVSLSRKASPHKSKIVSRKVGEKLRRDKLNGLVASLAEEVPFVSNSHRRLDRTAILRLTVSFLKLHHGLKRRRLKKALGCQGFPGVYSGFFQQAIDGALLIVSESGEILFVSLNIRDILGHHQSDIVGHNISAVIHPDDLQIFKSHFQGRQLPTSGAAFATFQKNESKDESKIELLESAKPEHFSMYIRFCKAVKKRSEYVTPREYELINVRGHIDRPVDGTKFTFDESGLMWMVAALMPVGNQAVREIDIGMSEFLKNNEWATQHGLDGKMWNVDHRGTLFHGYMVGEMLGFTPYVFIKEEDLKYVARSHQLIMKENEIPSTVFRMKNKFNLNLYIQSRSIIVNDRWTKQPKCIVSVNTVLRENEGKILLEEQRKRVEQLNAETEQLALTDIKHESTSEADSDKRKRVERLNAETEQLALTDIKQEPTFEADTDKRKRVEQLTAETEQFALTDIKQESTSEADSDIKEHTLSNRNISDTVNSDMGRTEVSNHDKYSKCSNCKNLVPDISGVSSADVIGGPAANSDPPSSRTGLDSCSCCLKLCQEKMAPHCLECKCSSGATGDSIECNCYDSSQGLNPINTDASALVPPVCMPSIANPTSLTAYGVKRPLEITEADLSDISDPEEENISEITSIDKRDGKSGIKLEPTSPEAMAKLQHFQFSMEKSPLNNGYNLCPGNQSKTEDPYPILKKMLANKTKDKPNCSLNTTLSYSLENIVDKKYSLDPLQPEQNDQYICSDGVYTGSTINDKDETDFLCDRDLKGFYSRSTSFTEKKERELNRDLDIGSKHNFLYQNSLKKSSHKSELFSDDLQVNQENPLCMWKNGIKEEQCTVDKAGFQQYPITTNIVLSRDNQNKREKAQQQKSQIELKFYSQLKDKHLKLKQSLKQQHSLLNIVGNQLKLGWETVLSHDQQRMHQQLIKKLSDMGHQLQIQTDILGDLEQEFNCGDHDNKMED